MTKDEAPDLGFNAIMTALQNAPVCPDQAFINNLARRYPRQLVERAYDLIQSKWPDTANVLSRCTYARIDGSEVSWSDSQLACVSKAVKAAILKIPNPSPPLRRILQNKDADVLVSANGGTGKTVIVFSAVDGNVGLPPDHIDQILAQGGFTTIFVRDYHCCFYLKGVASLGNSMPETLVALRKLLSDLGTTRLYTIGHSSGGFAALSYGIELNAHRIVSFSAYTNLSDTFCQSYGDTRALAVQRRARMVAVEKDLAIREKPEFGSFAGEVDLYFGALQVSDAHQAEDLERLPGVTLHPEHGYVGHEVICEIVEQGQLLRVIEGSVSPDL